MEINIADKEQNQMLQDLLVPESNEQVHYSPSPFGSHDQGTHQLQPETQMTLSELHWNTHSSAEQCEEAVEVFSIDDSYVWQSPNIQEDTVGCLQPLETRLQGNSKDGSISKGGNSEESLLSANATKTRKKLDKTKLCGARSISQIVNKRKVVRGKKVQKKSQGATFLKYDVWSNDDGKNAAEPLTPSCSKKELQEPMKSTVIEDDVSEVRKRFSMGCECQDSNCFDGLNAEAVFRHRLNIAELTKEEHDMYLMGLTMACLSDWSHTNRNKERQRLRANYVHQGRSVCLQAFLYLENCTCYQVKRIRKHVMTHGVVPRIHGNHRKRPHNTFALEIYCHATEFLKSFFRENGGKDLQSKTAPIFLGPEVTRKSVHQGYLEYCRKNAADVKVMSYSSFRHFMKEQFSQIRFRVVDGPGVPRETASKQAQSSVHSLSTLTQTSLDSNQGQASSSYKSVNTSNSSNHQDVEVLTLALMSGNQHLIHSAPEFRSRQEGALSADGNIVVIDTLPINSTNSFLSSVNKSVTTCSASSNSKLLTLNSPLCLVNSTNVSSVNPPALVPLNSFAMLGSNVIPFVFESKEPKDPSL